MSGSGATLEDGRRPLLADVLRLGSAVASALEAVRPWRVLAVLVVGQWLAVLALARAVRHAGWIYYQGGDQLWYYTTGWLLAHGHLGFAGVGYLWSALLAPISLAAGGNVLDAYPAIALLDVLVLLPVATVALYSIGARIGGRIFGYWVAALWIALPFVGILYTNQGYHQRYTELFLPQALGLTALADLPTLAAVVVSAAFAVRALLDERPSAVDALAAGLAAGAAIGMKPSAAIFLAGPALAFAGARRFRPAGLFAAALVPALVTMALWKWRSTGHIPIGSAYAEARLAAGALGLPLGAGLLNHLHFDWHHLNLEFANLREYFWSQRLIQWAPVAGAVGLARRSPRVALLTAGWFGAFVVVKGTYDNATLSDASLLRIMIPSFPAFVLLVASIPLLLPRVPGLLARRTAADARPPRALTRQAVAALVAVLLATAVVPLVAVAGMPLDRGPSPHAVILAYSNGPVPNDIDLGLKATAGPDGVVGLSWRSQSSGAGPAFYHVFRVRASQPDLSCDSSVPAARCVVTLADLGTTRESRYVDHPGAGRWTYRIGVAANWLNDPRYGDVYLMSSRVSVTAK